MVQFLSEQVTPVARVSPEVPLISNLPVWSNIALIRQYHENEPWPDAMSFAVRLLERFDMSDMAERKICSLKPEELFYAMLIRAATVRDASVVLDRPFRILPDGRDGRFVLAALQKVDDLIAEVHIFDYTREKGFYGESDGATD